MWIYRTKYIGILPMRHCLSKKLVFNPWVPHVRKRRRVLLGHPYHHSSILPINGMNIWVWVNTHLFWCQARLFVSFLGCSLMCSGFNPTILFWITTAIFQYLWRHNLLAKEWFYNLVSIGAISISGWWRPFFCHIPTLCVGTHLLLNFKLVFPRLVASLNFEWLHGRGPNLFTLQKLGVSLPKSWQFFLGPLVSLFWVTPKSTRRRSIFQKRGWPGSLGCLGTPAKRIPWIRGT